MGLNTVNQHLWDRHRVRARERERERERERGMYNGAVSPQMDLGSVSNPSWHTEKKLESAMGVLLSDV